MSKLEVMSQKDAEEITEKLLSLPVSERAYIADKLLGSLVQPDEESIEKQSEVSKEWAGQIRSRIKDFEAGNVETRDSNRVVDELLAELRQKNAHRTAS